MALTDVKCRGTKPGKVRQKLSDGGLQLWIQPNGSRLWQLIYQFEGKQSQMALGRYPEVQGSDQGDTGTPIRAIGVGKVISFLSGADPKDNAIHNGEHIAFRLSDLQNQNSCS